MKAEKIQNAEEYLIYCPGCKMYHSFKTDTSKQPCWSFNNDLEKPTFSPSLLVRYTRKITDEEHERIMAGEKLNIEKSVCHSFVKQGKIQFLGDCTHELAGQTVNLPDID